MKIYLQITIAIALTCSCKFSQAQWVKLNQDSTHLYSKVFFLNKDTGFVCGTDNFYEDAIILRTMDGGDSWDTTRITPGFWLMGIHFLNDSLGFAGGQDGRIIKTTNLGNTWQINPSCIQPADFTNIFLISEDSAFINGDDIRIYTPQSVPYCISHFNSYTYGYFPGTGELQFITEQIAYAAGGFGIFLKTFDRGLTWNFFNCDTTLYILGAKMTDQNHAVVVGKNGRYTVTNDGGLNWTFSVSINHHHLMDVDFYNNQYGFAVGGFSPNSHHWPSSGSYPIGSIWSTSDGGNTWSLVDSSYSDQLTDIHIVNDSLAFAVGLGGLVLRNQSHFSTLNNIQENNENLNFSVFPNPFSEEINISLSSAGSENHITLFDISGKLIFSHQFTGNNYRMNASYLSKGVYFIKIISDNGVATMKLVKIE
jgi:photosystem II stability/assembly factor-like uncharacterized protein